MKNQLIPFMFQKDSSMPIMMSPSSPVRPNVYVVEHEHSFVVDTESNETKTTKKLYNGASEVLKLKLKTKIKRTRKEEENVKIEEQEKQNIEHQLTEDDLKRRDDLRERNKISAKKHRLKKKEEKIQMEEEMNQLFEKKKLLLEKIKKLEAIRKKVFQLLRIKTEN